MRRGFQLFHLFLENKSLGLWVLVWILSFLCWQREYLAFMTIVKNEGAGCSLHFIYTSWGGMCEARA